MNEYLKSIIDQDEAAVVICDLEHLIVYMNPSAKKRYQSSGGEALIGKSLFDCHNQKSNETIVKVVDWFKKSKSNNKVHTFYNVKENKDVYMVALRDSEGELIGYYEKHEYRNVDDTPLYVME